MKGDNMKKVKAKKSLIGRISEMEKRHSKFAAIQEKKIAELSADNVKIRHRLNNISPHIIEPRLDKLAVRVSELNHLAYSLVFKTTVITETCYWMRHEDKSIAPNFSYIALWAFDAKSDAWWFEGKELTILRWAERLEKAWRNRKPIESPRYQKEGAAWKAPKEVRT